MNIMYLLFSFTTGGTERLVVDICNEMSDKDNKVYLYIVNNLYEEELLRQLNKDVIVELQNRPVGGGKFIGTLFRIAEFIKRRRIEVVHCNALDTPELLMLHPILFPKTKIVYTIHAVGQYDELNKLRILYRNRLCNKVIAISESVKNDIIRHGADPRKIVRVYNAIDVSKFTGKNNRQFDSNHLVIGNVARIVPEIKGQDILIESVALLRHKYPEIKCYFAGGVDSEHQEAYEKLKERIRCLGMENNIIFLGNINEIADFLCSLDIFVLPSRIEGFGLALIEAMAMGIPCIAGNLAGPAEIIGDDEYGLLFERENAQMLADKIDYIARDYPVCKEKADKGARYVQKTFDIRVMCERLMEIYLD